MTSQYHIESSQPLSDLPWRSCCFYAEGIRWEVTRPFGINFGHELFQISTGLSIVGSPTLCSNLALIVKDLKFETMYIIVTIVWYISISLLFIKIKKNVRNLKLVTSLLNSICSFVLLQDILDIVYLLHYVWAVCVMESNNKWLWLL